MTNSQTDSHLVVMDLGQLTSDHLSVQQVGADIVVEHKEDDEGDFSLIKFTRGAAAPKWIATRVEIPQVAFPNGAEWGEIEMYSSGAPLRIVADATDRSSECFELVFCHPDVSWHGWRRYRTSLRSGSDNLGDDRLVTYTIRGPLRIKYLLIIMRQGQDWELGLRKLTIRLDPGSRS